MSGVNNNEEIKVLKGIVHSQNERIKEIENAIKNCVSSKDLTDITGQLKEDITKVEKKITSGTENILRQMKNMFTNFMDQDNNKSGNSSIDFLESDNEDDDNEMKENNEHIDVESYTNLNIGSFKSNNHGNGGAYRNVNPQITRFPVKSIEHIKEEEEAEKMAQVADIAADTAIRRYQEEADNNRPYFVPISGMMLTKDQFNDFQRNWEYSLKNNKSNCGHSFPSKEWFNKYGLDTSKETMTKLGFKISSGVSEETSMKFGWSWKSCPNTRRALWDVQPYCGPEARKDGSLKNVDYRPKPGSNNNTNSVGNNMLGIPVYQDGGAVFGFGFGGSYVASGSYMPVN